MAMDGGRDRIYINIIFSHVFLAGFQLSLYKHHILYDYFSFCTAAIYCHDVQLHRRLDQGSANLKVTFLTKFIITVIFNAINVIILYWSKV